MARCGRCGLYSEYPEDYPEKKWAGACLWFNGLRLPEDEVWESRSCDYFFERIPGLNPKEHFDYAIKKDTLGRVWKTSKRSLVFSLLAFAISIATIVTRLLK